MLKPASLIKNLASVSKNPLIFRLMMSSEIALKKRYGDSFSAIPYIAKQDRDKKNLDVMHELLLRHCGQNMLLFNEGLVAIESTNHEVNFSLIALHRNIGAILLELEDLKRQGIDPVKITKDTPAYACLCEAAHTGWSTVVISDSEAILHRILKHDPKLHQIINDLQEQLITALNKNQSGEDELDTLNLCLKQNQTHIMQYTSGLVLCSPKRELDTLGNAYALAVTEYGNLPQEEQEKNQVLVNGTLIELEIIYFELNKLPFYSSATLNQYHSIAGQAFDNQSQQTYSPLLINGHCKI